jgi:hypothetical protein
MGSLARRPTLTLQKKKKSGLGWDRTAILRSYGVLTWHHIRASAVTAQRLAASFMTRELAVTGTATATVPPYRVQMLSGGNGKMIMNSASVKLRNRLRPTSTCSMLSGSLSCSQKPVTGTALVGLATVQSSRTYKEYYRLGYDTV